MPYAMTIAVGCRPRPFWRRLLVRLMPARGKRPLDPALLSDHLLRDVGMLDGVRPGRGEKLW